MAAQGPEHALPWAPRLHIQCQGRVGFQHELRLGGRARRARGQPVCGLPLRQMAQVAFQRQLQAQMQAQMRQQQAALQAQLRAAQAQAQAAALQAQQYQRAASLVSLPWPTPPRFGWPAQRGGRAAGAV